jgi:ABC-2 type transport system ATP-binding protein
MIEVSALCKQYGTTVAVADLSFEAKPREVLGFLGPNGAGKTTTLRMIAGALGPTGGTIRIAGHDLMQEPMRARQCLGYMPEAAPLYPELRVDEFLLFRAALKGVAVRQQKAAVQEAMHKTNLEDFAQVTIAHLSKGYRQRVALADALVAKPPVYILDEPTAGLDPNQIRETRALIRELGAEHTVVVSSHILGEIEELCDRAVVIHQGHVVAAGTIDELRQDIVAAPTLFVVVRDPQQLSQDICRALAGIVRVNAQNDSAGVLRLTIEIARGQNRDTLCEELVRRLVAAGIGVLGVEAKAARLEDIFAALTQEASAAPEKSKGNGA